MNIPNCDQARVPKEKMIAYLLDPEHPEGAPKAAFFASHGFSIDRVEVLEAALIAHAAEEAVTDVIEGEFGTKYVVEAPILCPDGGAPLLRSVCIITRDSTNPRRATAYPFM